MEMKLGKVDGVTEGLMDVFAMDEEMRMQAIAEIEAEEATRRAEEAHRNSEHLARHQQSVADRDKATTYRSAPQSPSLVDGTSRRRREADEMAPRR